MGQIYFSLLPEIPYPYPEIIKLGREMSWLVKDKNYVQVQHPQHVP